MKWIAKAIGFFVVLYLMIWLFEREVIEDYIHYSMLVIFLLLVLAGIFRGWW